MKKGEKMEFHDESRLFTVAEVAKACDISRTSLIRLEESGFFSPCYTDPDTGYRYYDVKNVVEIGRYKRFRNIGMTKNEITGLFHGSADRELFMKQQLKKLNDLQTLIDDLRLLENNDDKCISDMLLPSHTCYCEDFSPSSFEEGIATAHTIYEKVIAEGYRMIPEEPPFVISDEWQAVTKDTPAGSRFSLCIHVLPSPSRLKDSHIRSFPETRALCVSGFGGFSTLPDLISTLYSELSERKLEAKGPVRFITLATDAASSNGFIHKFIVPATGRGPA